MKNIIENTIKILASKSEQAEHPIDAMQYAQAALNFAQTAATMDLIRRNNETEK
jgi:hypothetical protein